MSANSSTYFISDLHLDTDRPQITRAFLSFLDELPSNTQALYILGDLFEAWIGDEQLSEFPDVQNTLSDTTQKFPIFFLHGNRDFLVGKDFSESTGVQIITDPYTLNWNDRKIILLHGDTLCTDDTDYQSFRQMVRSSDWQRTFLAKPFAERQLVAREMREESRRQQAEKSAYITDINSLALRAFADEHNADLIIHGHTHRPNKHFVNLKDKQIIRYVLGDWCNQAAYLELTERTIEERILPIAP